MHRSEGVGLMSNDVCIHLCHQISQQDIKHAHHSIHPPHSGNFVLILDTWRTFYLFLIKVESHSQKPCVQILCSTKYF